MKPSLLNRFPGQFRTGLMLAALAAPACIAQPKDGPPLDGTHLMSEVDTDRDGCATREEWLRAEAPVNAFETLKDALGCVTVAGIRAKPAPDGLDANHDGQLTLAELIAFDKRLAASPGRP